MNRRRKKKSRGFTDLMWMANFVSVSVISVVVIILTALSGKLAITDMSALGIVAGAAFAELSAVSAFTIRKNDHENCEKIKQSIDVY